VRHVPLVLFAEDDRDQPGRPVVAVDDVRPLSGLAHELDGGAGKECESLGVVAVPVQAPPAEDIRCRMRLNEKAFPPVRVAEPDGAAHRAAVPRHPQITVAGLQAPNAVVPHAGVLRQDDLDRVSPEFQFAAEARHRIAEPACLGHRGALRGHHHDIHNSPTPSRLMHASPRPSPYNAAGKRTASPAVDETEVAFRTTAVCFIHWSSRGRLAVIYRSSELPWQPRAEPRRDDHARGRWR
jgi:hypothetical protein